MSDGPSPVVRRYLGFAAAAAGLTAVLALVGWRPTARWGGGPALTALAAGCGVSLAASLVSGLVVARAASRGPQMVLTALTAMGVRLAVVVVLAAAIAALGGLPFKPFLLWVAISYVGLLMVDTRYALGSAGAGEPKTGPEPGERKERP